MLLATGTIKGIAEAQDVFYPADHGLSDRDVAELLACAAAEVVADVVHVAGLAAADAARAPTAVKTAAAMKKAK